MSEQKPAAVDRFLAGTQRVRWISLGVQIVLLAAATWISLRIQEALTLRYTRTYGWITALVLGTLLVILLVQHLARFAQRNERTLARDIDRRFQLKERLTTYLEIRAAAHPFFEALSSDTEKNIRRLSPWMAIRPLQELRTSAGALVFSLLLLSLIPYLPVPETVANIKNENKQILEQTKQLQHVLEQIQKKKDLSPQMKKFLSEALKEIKELQKPETQKLEALKQLNSLQDKLARLQAEKLADRQNALAKKLQQTRKQSNRNDSAANSKDFDKLAEEIQKALGDQSKDLNASKGANDNKPSRSLSQQDLEKMKKALEDYKKETAESEQRMAEAQRALENAKKGMGRGAHKVTSNSKLKDRDVEKGKGGVEDGAGTTNVDTGPQHFNTKKEGTGAYEEDKTKAKYEQLYKGERTDAKSDPLIVGSHWNDQGELRSQSIRSFGLNSDSTASAGGNSTAPQNGDESEIQKEKVPATYQKMVKEYFESIDNQ